MSKHTPGPWKRQPGNQNHEIDGETGAVCSLYGLTRGRRKNPRHQEASANAKLIIAAPDLLEAAETGAAALMSVIEITENLPMNLETKKSLHETIMNIVKIMAPVILKAKGEL